LIDVHLYGKLRRFTEQKSATEDSILFIEPRDKDTIRGTITRLNIPLSEIGSNIFLNGELSSLDRAIKDGDRLGVFPDDMQLLYKWYFKRME
jgi:molybdopterin converting factor small subunit